ncbi:MAG: DNA-processing protein DprA [Paracoccaceae bacterium]|nr:DNA-processing protein DprA [Paracoccaceae bacterium]MDG1738235.1 DNA-processing protein DprA [Paracoccaceae bacterium]MDG2259912.1 DNA-processing protein DprA [Paracoccaceae bacterium]
MQENSNSSTHPPFPPSSEDDQVTWLRLLRSRRVGTATFYRLLNEHGTAKAALEALPDVAAKAGVENYSTCSRDVAVKEMTAGRKAGARLVFMGATDYPKRLCDLPDAPPFFWMRGHTSVLSSPTIAIVGARNASSLGTRMARKLASELGEAGYTIVSGLARGVDTAAHVGSLKTGGIAVLAGGIETIYPAENTELAANILNSGALISEQPIGLVAQARHFPMRNRLISGLAKAVVVIEAATRSGSLITARNALDQGRDILVVPGHPMDNRAAGCNHLIRDGATLVRSAEDIIEALGPEKIEPDTGQSALDLAPPKTSRKQLHQTASLHGEILTRLGPSPLSEDQLIRDLRADSQHISPALTELEMTGKIARQAGGLLALASGRR